jgi:hypothetical protein
VDTNVQTLVDVTPELARQVQALYNEIPEQLGSILEQLNVNHIISPAVALCTNTVPEHILVKAAPRWLF